jgi:hypothetical protein
MSDQTCDYPGCTNPLFKGCSDCGGKFCSGHVAYMSIIDSGVNTTSGYYCKTCMEKMIVRNRQRARVGKWITLGTIAGCLLAWPLNSIMDTSIIFVLGFVLLIVGPVIWIINQYCVTKRTKFYRSNYII